MTGPLTRQQQSGPSVELFGLWEFCGPSPFRSLKGCFRRWSSPNNLPASVGNFGQIGASPHHAIDQGSPRAPGSDLGAHGTHVLQPERDEKTAQFRVKLPQGRSASAPCAARPADTRDEAQLPRLGKLIKRLTFATRHPYAHGAVTLGFGFQSAPSNQGLLRLGSVHRVRTNTN